MCSQHSPADMKQIFAVAAVNFKFNFHVGISARPCLWAARGWARVA